MPKCQLCDHQFSELDSEWEHVKNTCESHPGAGTLWSTARGTPFGGGGFYTVVQCGRMGNKSFREDECIGCAGCREEKVQEVLQRYSPQLEELRTGVAALGLLHAQEQVVVALSGSLYFKLSWQMPNSVRSAHAAIRFSDHAPGPKSENGEGGEGLLFNIWGAMSITYALGIIKRQVEEQRAAQRCQRW